MNMKIVENNRSAVYFSGNYTEILVFSYNVQLGDSSGFEGLITWIRDIYRTDSARTAQHQMLVGH